MTVHISVAGPGVDQWDELVELISTAFAPMEGRIDPPSSSQQLTAGSLAAKAAAETMLIAWDGDDPVGCVFAAERGDDALYISKLAVRPERQRQGIARRLMLAAEQLAREQGRAELLLNTRIELVDNHATFSALGYRIVERHAHPGFDRPTYLTMSRSLA